jgi:hypothetical protein
MPEPCAVSTGTSGWTTETLKVYFDAAMAADERFHVERDRRYESNRMADAKALTIKETADLAALSLARDRQAYEADRADKLRDQSMTERGAYVTREDLTSAINRIEASLKPLYDFVSGQKGIVQGAQLTTAKLLGFIAATGTIMAIVFALINAVTK